MRLAALPAALVILAACVGVGPRARTTDAPRRASPPLAAQSSAASPARADEYIPDQFGETQGRFDEVALTEEKTLTHAGHQVLRRTKRVRLEDSDVFTDIEYAELRRGGRRVAGFGEDSGEPHSTIRFGLLNLLGGPDEQLVIEQTANRFWRYWVVRLSPRPEAVYDSGRYSLVHRLRSADLDGDGRRELILSLGTFWFFDGLNNVDSPRPPVVFAFDAGARRYAPAGHRFQGVLLEDVDRRVSRVRELGRPCAGVLDVVIRHLYAGKERDAWAFFERDGGGVCRPRHGEQLLKSRLEAALAGDALYGELSAAAR